MGWYITRVEVKGQGTFVDYRLEQRGFIGHFLDFAILESLKWGSRVSLRSLFIPGACLRLRKPPVRFLCAILLCRN